MNEPASTPLPQTAEASAPAFVFALNTPLVGGAAKALDTLLASSPELSFQDLLDDARGNRLLDWKADPEQVEAVRQRVHADAAVHVALPPVEPPPDRKGTLRSWAARYQVAPLLHRCAVLVLRRWMSSPRQRSLGQKTVFALLTVADLDPGLRQIARGWIWAQAITFEQARLASAGRTTARHPTAKRVLATAEAEPTADAEPSDGARAAGAPAAPVAAWESFSSTPAGQRARQLAEVFERAAERYRSANRYIPSPVRRNVRFQLDGARGELKADWANRWNAQWTYVSIEEGHEGETHCDCLGTHDGDCIHCYWSWTALARLLSGHPADLPGEFRTFLATPAWQRRLRALDRVLQATARTDPAEVQLSWRLVPSDSTPSLEPLLHVRLQSGEWSPGRRVERAELARTHGLPLRTEVLALLGNREALYPTSNVFRVLELLAGSPELFLDGHRGQPLVVRRAAFDLELREQDDGKLQLRPRIDGDPELGGRLAATTRQGPRRVLIFSDPPTCLLVELTAAQQALLEAMGGGWELPPEGVGELLSRLPELERSVPLSLPPGLEAQTALADGRLRLRLTAAAGPSLHAELRVRPLSAGAHHVPGRGPASVTVYTGQQWQRAERDLDSERERARALSVELGLPDEGAATGFGWQLRGEPALKLLDRLRRRDGDEPLIEWCTKSKLEVLRTPSTGQLKVRLEEKRDWFGLSGELEIDGTQVPLARLLEAARSGARWIEVEPGRWAEFAGELREKLAGAAEVVYAGRGGLELSPAAAGAVDDLFDAAGELELCAAWREMAGRMKHARGFEPQLPAGLRAELRGYQVEGYRWLSRMAHWGVGACLADDMGLGKTLQALAVLLERGGRGPALVVAPTSVCFNWVRETERFCPGLRPVLFREGDRAATLSALGPGDLLVCSYGLLVRHAEELKGRRFATLVLDEAQAVKNPATRRARAARDLDAEWKLALTGTPVENHLGELWSLFRVLTPGLLGSWEQFRERFANPIERTRDPGRRAALARVVRPFVLRRIKAEVARDLPARTELQREVRLSAGERRLYDEARLAALAAIGGAGAGAEGGEKRFVVLAALTRLRQLACHPRLIDPESKLPSAKLAELMELVAELRENGHRALVFSQFTSHLALVREALEARGVSYLYLDGQTPEAERARRVDRFQRGEKELFLISLKAGGTGLNLTAADFVIHLDPWWNPAVEDQATDRAHRIGQSRPVTVYRLVSKGTIEESILALHGEKRDLVAGVLEGAAGTAGLSTEELLELLRGGTDETEAEEPGDESDRPQDEAAGAAAAEASGSCRGKVAPESAVAKPAAPEAAPTGTGAQSAESLEAFAVRFEASLLSQLKPSTAKVYLSAATQLFRWMESQRGCLREEIDAREVGALLERYESSMGLQPNGVSRTVANRMRRFAAG